MLPVQPVEKRHQSALVMRREPLSSSHGSLQTSQLPFCFLSQSREGETLETLERAPVPLLFCDCFHCLFEVQKKNQGESRDVKEGSAEEAKTTSGTECRILTEK